MKKQPKISRTDKDSQAADAPVFSRHLRVVRVTKNGILLEGLFNVGIFQFWAPKNRVVKQDGVYGIKASFLAEKLESFAGVEVDATGCRELRNWYGFALSVTEFLSGERAGHIMWFSKSECEMMPGNILRIPGWMFQSELERLYGSMKVGALAYSSNDSFKIGGLDRFSRQNVEIVV